MDYIFLHDLTNRPDWMVSDGINVFDQFFCIAVRF